MKYVRHAAILALVFACAGCNVAAAAEMDGAAAVNEATAGAISAGSWRRFPAWDG